MEIRIINGNLFGKSLAETTLNLSLVEMFFVSSLSTRA
jgi:hypothetical protein